MAKCDPTHRRLTNEWALLTSLAEANPEVLRVEGKWLDGDTTVFAASLRRTTGLVGKPGDLCQLDIHAFELRFPRFFPSSPIEAWLRRPIFHPNIHPENGFVCLWSAFSSRHTTFDALNILQRVIRWEFYNLNNIHVMQTEAEAWISSGSADCELPLPYVPLENTLQHIQAADVYASPSVRPTRRRLTACGEV